MSRPPSTGGLIERLRAMLTWNLNLKILSFGLALLLYSMVHGGHDSRRSVVVDLDVNLPQEGANVQDTDRVLVSALPQSIRIAVRGSSQTIDNLRDSTVSIVLDLTKRQPFHVQFEPSMVRLPEGVHVEIEQFTPPSLDLRWEARITREKPIQVSVVGAPAAGFVVKGALFARPKFVTVRGPESEVSVLQFVRVDAFDVGGLTEGTYPRNLAIDRGNHPRLTIEPTTAVVTAEIAREVAERVFQKLPVSVVGIPKGRSTPGEVDVRLVCPPEIVRSLRPEQIVPQVEVTSREAAGSVALPVRVRIDKCEAHVTPQEVIARWGL